MDLGNLPTFTPNLDKLTDELEKLCQKFSISRFEAEDIIELLTDGEDVEWLIEQLQQDNAELDKDNFFALLSSIQFVVAPPKEETEKAETESEPEFETEKAIDSAALTGELSQLDLSQMKPELEQLLGKKLPPGMDLKQIQKMMEGPQGKLMTDFAAWCQEQGIDMSTITDQKKIQELNEQWMQTPRPAFDGQTPAEISQNDPSVMGFKKVETYRRDAPRIGRNDPCPCGSGKKYKKCCGHGN